MALRILASGTIVEVHSDGTTTRPTPHPDFILHGCGWLIEVATNHPEPDSPSDCYDIVPCGAPVFTIPGNPSGWRCAEGHQYRGIEVEWAIDAAVEMLERAHGRDADPAETAQLRDLVTR